MKTIGRYIIQGLLGRGGMGKVFKVKIPTIDKIAALKILAPDPLLKKMMGMDPLRTLFIHEAMTMAGLNHPHIVSVNDFDEHNSHPFFVMDFYPNNLGALMGESYIVERPTRPIPVEKALKYALQTLDGLDCLHDADILHRDIKPFNLLVTARDRIKICDFGLSKLRNESFTSPVNLNVGSPYYAAPEQESDPDGMDRRGDLYPIGIMLYRMLTCRLPYLRNTDCEFQPPSSLNSDLDMQWDTFFIKAIARNRSDRFQDAAGMKRALTELQFHWREQKELSCALPDNFTDKSKTGTASSAQVSTRRHAPIKIRPKQAVVQFQLNKLWQPETYTVNEFVIDKEKTITDKATRLTWQISGCAFPRTWIAANAYISQLNQTAYAGIKNWRLPTIDELVTLLTVHPKAADLCIAPLFDQRQRWIWSADRRSYLSAYYVDMELGFVGWQDFSAPYYVRAVSYNKPGY